MGGDRVRMARTVAIGAGILATVMTIACWPTTRLVGVNYVVTPETLPLWAKVVNFIDRDVNLSRLARVVLSGAADDEARAAAALAWTRANVRPTPPGLPVIDDHVWHIVVRGYGQPDQQADVFTTVLTYSGLPAYWHLIGARPEEVPLSYVWIRDRWRVYDVARGLVFRDRGGDLATPEVIATDAGLVRAAAATAGLDADRYLAHFAGYRAPRAPDVLRADLQRPGRRLRHELRKLIGVGGREWETRPAMTVTPAEERQP